MVAGPLALSLGLDFPHWHRERAAPDASEGLSPGLASPASRGTAWGEAALGKHSPRRGDLEQKLGRHSCAAGQAKGYTVTGTPLHRPV